MVTIGFNGTYSVREDVGGISIVVFALINSLARDVVVTPSTLDNTARGRFAHCLNCRDRYWLFTYIVLHAAGMDYTHVSRSLTFNASITTQMVEVPIVDDHIVEHSEIINLTLVSTDSAVILNPSTSTITIEDVDSKLHTVCRSPNIWVQFILFTTLVVTIGFNKTAYSASEDASSVSITLSVEIGALDRDVIVTLSSINGTAMRKFWNNQNPL